MGKLESEKHTLCLEWKYERKNLRERKIYRKQQKEVEKRKMNKKIEKKQQRMTERMTMEDRERWERGRERDDKEWKSDIVNKRETEREKGGRER